MYKFTILLIIFILVLSRIYSQNVGIGTATPDPTSKLEVYSNNSGLLIPRLTTAERNAIVNPADALMIYNLTTRCLEIYDAPSSTWVPIGCTGCQLPDNFAATAATSLTSNSFTANWTTSFGATSYILEVATDAAFTSYVTGYNNLNVGFVTSFNVTGLTCGMTYYYRVKASNACGTTPVTNTISVTLNPGGSGKITFDYVSDNYQTWTVPACVTSITIKAWGAGAGGGGGRSYSYTTDVADGGGASYSTTIVSVTPGDVLRIYVPRGGNGGLSCVAGTGGGAGGWGYGSGGNGGNAGGAGCSGGGGGGGGSAAVVNFTTSTVLIAAAGGGGGGGFGCDQGDRGGIGGAGGQNGSGGVCSTCGTCGTGGIAAGNTIANGQNGFSRGGLDGGGGGGGGGGYTNGGAGGNIGNCDCAAGGAGGGNSFGTITNGSGRVPGNSSDTDLCTGCGYGGVGGNTYHGNGQNGGNGRVVIIY